MNSATRIQSDYLQALSGEYLELESRFYLQNSSQTFSKLVTSTENKFVPVHRWFHQKESFSIHLLEHLLDSWDIPAESINHILDPFCGVGTTLLSAQMLAHKYNLPNLMATGIERNPFIHFAANTKSSWQNYSREIFAENTDYLLNGIKLKSPKTIPPLSTLKKNEVFSKYKLTKTLSYREAINNVKGIERNLLLLGFASILEGISGTRKDGRALRIVPQKRQMGVKSALKKAWTIIAQDLNEARKIYLPIATEVLLGDGIELVPDNQKKRTLDSSDLIIYSPPYLNNIDYSEVYKIELWMSGFISNQDEFRNLRHSTLRSHPSVRFNKPFTISSDKKMSGVLQLLQLLVDSFPKDKNKTWRKELIFGYFDDMYKSLSKQIEVLSPGGWIFCVVGNSLHGPGGDKNLRTPIASDLLIAEIAQNLGLEIKAIQIARHLNRRSPHNYYLRESIIAMRMGESKQ